MAAGVGELDDTVGSRGPHLSRGNRALAGREGGKEGEEMVRIDREREEREEALKSLSRKGNHQPQGPSHSGAGPATGQGLVESFAEQVGG